jgi:DNA-binding response OmpR family regulator
MNKRRCIMAVDDEKEILILLKKVLEEAGYDFVGTTSSDSAISLLCQKQPALVILDITMPGLDGFQVLDLIRKKSDVPVIMLTGKGEVAALREAVEIGADDYVRKPFYTKELLARVGAKLRRTAQTQPTLPRGK